MAMAYNPRKGANGQVATSTTSGELVAARGAAGRTVKLKNIDDTDTVYVGFGTVASTSGLPLKPGESIAIETTEAINGIASANTPKVAYIEEYYS